MIKLFLKIGIVFLGAFILSIGFDSIYRQSIGEAYKPPRNMLPHPEIYDKYKLVKIGNSHAEDGLTFEKYKIKSLRLASVAQTYEYDLALLKMHEKQIDKNAVIIINVSPISFSQKKPDKDDNVNTQYYDGRLSPFLIPHINVSEYLQVQIVPFIRSGYLWRTQYGKETKEKAMSNYAEAWNVQEEKKVEPPQAVTDTPPILPEFIEPVEPTAAQPVQSAIPRSDKETFSVQEIENELNMPPDPPDARLMESTEFMVNKWNNSGGFDTESFDTNRKDFQAIIDYCIEKGWRPVLVTLPINQVLLDALEPGYLKRYIYDNVEKSNIYDAPYINFATDRRLTTNKYLYSNSDHLNKKGAAITSYLLLQRLVEMNYLPKETNGYDYSENQKK